MLRIWFGSEDLARGRVARRPHALWETVLSIQALRTRGRAPLPGWRDAALARLGTPRASAALRLLRPLVPVRGYLPDFLTPPECDLDGGVAAVLRTPRRRVAAELDLLACQGGAEGEDGPLPRPGRRLADALTQYHEAALAPFMPRMRALVDADRAVRARALLDGGVEALLETLRPAVRWRRPVLETDYPVDQELRLDGRGLLLVPSVFCERTPISLFDPELPPTLVYPVGDDGPPASGPAAEGVAALIGGTRGAVLWRLGEAAATTSELARVLDISTASASQHASVLRRSGLVVSRRAGNAVIHRITPLGAALLSGGDH